MGVAFPHLKRVDLSQCPPLKAGQITALQAMPSLVALRALLLDEGQLLAVAAEIAQLRGLTSLILSGCGPHWPPFYKNENRTSQSSS